MISIIIPVYNVALYLKECLDSVINQTFRDWEGILIDDGSTDGSGHICDEYAAGDPRFRVIHQANQGITPVRNRGLKEARGEYFAWVDSDDVVHPKWLETLYDIIKSHECDIAVVKHVSFRGTSIHIDNEVKIKEAQFVPNDQVAKLMIGTDPKEMSCTLWTKLYRREIIEDLAFFFQRAQDLDFNIQLLVKGARFYYSSTPLYYYRIRENAITGGYGLSFLLNDIVVRCDIYDHYLTLDKDLKYQSIILESIYQHLLYAQNYAIYNNTKPSSDDEAYYQEVYRRTWADFMKCKNDSKTIKAKMLLLRHCPWLYFMLVKVKKLRYGY